MRDRIGRNDVCDATCAFLIVKQPLEDMYQWNHLGDVSTNSYLSNNANTSSMVQRCRLRRFWRLVPACFAFTPALPLLVLTVL
jgi:hypothetical protein